MSPNNKHHCARNRTLVSTLASLFYTLLLREPGCRLPSTFGKKQTRNPVPRAFLATFWHTPVCDCVIHFVPSISMCVQQQPFFSCVFGRTGYRGSDLSGGVDNCFVPAPTESRIRCRTVKTTRWCEMLEANFFLRKPRHRRTTQSFAVEIMVFIVKSENKAVRVCYAMRSGKQK